MEHFGITPVEAASFGCIPVVFAGEVRRTSSRNSAGTRLFEPWTNVSISSSLS